MSSSIKGTESPLSCIFSSEYSFVIPAYQRPYDWGIEQAEALFNDLYDFYTEEKEKEDENYFLGSIVLIKDENHPHSEVIDGQQRLTTLTILLSLICSKFTPEDQGDFRQYIIDPGNKFKKIKSEPRLSIRDCDNDFFKKYVQDMNISDLIKLEPNGQKTEAQNKIIANAQRILSLLDKRITSYDDLFEFSSFLINRCYIVVVTTPTQTSAFRVFSVLNNRGLDLRPTDIIKAEIIGAISTEIRGEYTNKWEKMENDLGRDGFNDLFSQIRMIWMKKKSREKLREEFFTYVLKTKKVDEKTAENLIDNILEPYAEAYWIFTHCAYSSPHGADDVNDILSWLNQIGNSDWLPVAMLYYNKFGNNSSALNQFLIYLECLASYMLTASWDINHRIERYGKILQEIENSADEKHIEFIKLTQEETSDFIDRLNSDVYKMVPQKRGYLIKRLDTFVSDGAAKYNSSVLTIEHVLPQTVPTNSEWEKNWPTEEIRQQWLHKIGNLIPLTKRTNSKAQNYEFNVKKDKYFSNKSGTTSYALATQVLNYNEWTPEIVQKRQKELVNSYIKGWHLLTTD